MSNKYTTLMLMLLLVSFAMAHAEEKVKAATKYMIFREDCYEAFFTRFDFFTDQTCLKFTISKTLGYAIVGGATVYKVPQIKKILSDQSAKGISSFSYYFETIAFIQTLGLSMHLKMDFSIYGDAILILGQNAVVIFLIWKFDKGIGMAEKVASAAFLTAYCIVLVQDTMMTEELWGIVQSLSLAVPFFSRGPQIIKNFSEGSTGALSFVTMTLGWAGSMTRLLTVYAESDDFYYRL